VDQPKQQIVEKLMKLCFKQTFLLMLKIGSCQALLPRVVERWKPITILSCFANYVLYCAMKRLTAQLTCLNHVAYEAAGEKKRLMSYYTSGEKTCTITGCTNCGISLASPQK